MVRNRSLAIAGFLALAMAAPAAAQVQDWQDQWYWGAKGGLIRYSLPSGNVARPQGGGEWLITARHAALYVAYSTSFTQDVDNYAGPSNTTFQMAFDAMQRIQIALLVFPWGGHIQPYLGGGFEIETLSNATINCVAPLTPAQCTNTLTPFINQHSAGGFALVMAGAQIRFGKLAIFGQAQLSPQGRDFLLRNSSQSIEFGVRYAFLGAREDDVTTRR